MVSFKKGKYFLDGEFFSVSLTNKILRWLGQRPYFMLPKEQRQTQRYINKALTLRFETKQAMQSKKFRIPRPTLMYAL